MCFDYAALILKKKKNYQVLLTRFSQLFKASE